MKGIFWFRRDLRLEDNIALSLATQECDEVYPIFIFDPSIIDDLPRDDRRVGFILTALKKMDKKVHLFYGDPEDVFKKIINKVHPDKVYSNLDFEPYAKKRDKKIQKICRDNDIDFIQECDQTIFYPRETLKKDGGAYQVFTPYKNNWLSLLRDDAQAKLKKFNVDLKKLAIKKSLGDMDGFDFADGDFFDPYEAFDDFKKKIKDYNTARDIPSMEGTSKLSVHLRFGTISIRKLVREVWKESNKGAEVWLSELIWREFYFAILNYFPHVVDKAFREKYDKIRWKTSKKNQEAWEQGMTGVPIVDAAMRDFNKTGWMHNRLRMIVASYFCKILQLDWRKGEAYFAKNLIDFDLSANNGGWQWSSGSGCDAAPYFRIFNPYTQAKKFDKDGEYIKKHLPELKGFPTKYLYRPDEAPLDIQMNAECIIGQDYPHAIVNYEDARKECLERYKDALN